MSGPELPYWVTFYERDAPQKRYTARLGDTPPTPSGGGSGWEVVQLPKRSAVRVWRGRQGLVSMTITLMIGDATGGPIKLAHTPLWAMYRPLDETTEPPVVKVRSPGDAVPLQALDYVVDDIAWGDAHGGPLGNRLIQKCVVTLGEYRADEVLQQGRAAKPKHRGRSYVVKSGDTLSALAKRFKVKGGWRAIADAQHPPIRDPRQLKTGQRLLIP